MQPQFGSVSLVANAYERELRADAARVRPIRRGEAGRRAASAPLARCRVAVGAGLVRVGGRLQGASATPATPAGSPPTTGPSAAW